nr:hypothetical protein [Bradyrhizobium sp.]
METVVSKKRRRRFKQTLPLGERLLMAASLARDAAEQMPPGAERTKLLMKAREAEAIAQLEQCLSTRRQSHEQRR